MPSLYSLILNDQLQSLPENASINCHWLGEGILQLLPINGWRNATVLSAGIHGNETAPIELLLALTQQILASESYQGHALLIIFGNIPAITCGKRYINVDMNRLFNGRHQHYAYSTEALRAKQLEQAVSHFFQRTGSSTVVPRFHLDLHTTIRASRYPQFALLPAVAAATSPLLNQLLESAELDAIVQHSETGNTFAHFTAATYQGCSVTLELGKIAPFGCNVLAEFSAAQQAIKAFIFEQPLPVRRKSKCLRFIVRHSLIKQDTRFQLHLDAQVDNFTQLPVGYLLAEQPGQQWTIDLEAPYLLFPNAAVAIGQRACLLLQKIDI